MATKDAVSAAVGTQPVEFNILSVTFDSFNTALNVNLPISVSLLFAAVIVVVGLKNLIGGFKGFGTEEVTIKDPFTGTEVKIKANAEDKKVAHRIWTELVTRKAALPFQRDKDVIVEVYDSWHTLFQCVREQIAAIPVEKLRGREKEDIESLIDISTKVLNEGLRPHLTEWQAKYRAWYESAKAANNGKSPQELQREYPEYSQLVDDITSVNRKLKEFADELKKIVRANQ